MSFKLSIVISTQPASFSALAYQGKLAENVTKIRALGYDGVELAVRDPKLLHLAELTTSIESANLQVPAIGTGQAFGEEGLSFTHPDEKVRMAAIERIEKQIALAVHFGAVVIIGLIRGQHVALGGMEKTEQWLIEALQVCAAMNPKVRLAIEPINRYETEMITTVSAGLRLLDILQRENVGLLLDTFHMNIEEPSIFKSIELAKDRIFHFHIADSNRWHPGAGHIDFARVIDVLNKIGYTSFLSAEILPLPDADTAAKKTSDYLRPLIK